MHKSVYISIIIVAIVLGLMASMQIRFNSAGDNSGETALTRGREQELSQEKNRLARDIDLLKDEFNDLYNKIEEASKGRSEAEVAMYSEFVKISGFAGLTDLTGPGVTVVLDIQPDNAHQKGLNSVRDTDLLKIINDLRGAGAEAISVNEQRVLATSEVRESGKHINVNLVRIAPPYVIKAIGNPTMLQSSLVIKYGIIEDLQGRDISVSVDVGDDVFVPAYSGTLSFNYATPTPEGG